MFQPVNPSNFSFPAQEKEILAWWHSQQIMQKSLDSGEKPFIFYEGPPTANGRPGFHHSISRIFKDVILRYKAMQGYKIIGRREGWDTHGLPVEIEVEKELGFSGKPDIEKYGIAEFNTKCRASVWKYIQEWKQFTDRIAYWVSEDAYITYDNAYIESLWWIFGQLWQRDLLYRDYKVTMHCPRCGTGLSDHEVSLGFKEGVDDPSVWVRFRLSEGKSELLGSNFLAWTTTPWTLPANAALCVKPDAEYVMAKPKDSSERLILAAALVTAVLGEDATIEQTFQGQDLIGMRYEPLFRGVPGPSDTIGLNQAYRVIADDFVSLEDGTGIVHIAPAYGDLEIGQRYGLPTLFSVNLNGEILPEYAELGFADKFFKDADPLITQNLQDRGLLFRSGRVSHSYPFCWRCSTPLLYFAKPSWYIRTTAFKQNLIANNQKVHWVPDHIRDGRFGNWLENNVDWAISRERYWGTPLPIWISEDGKQSECISSIAELEQKVGRSLKDLDLHRPYVDELTWEAPNGHGIMRRIPDVADCWFDSGAMQVAQWHYPFENKELFANAHPADYICEAVDQTRGWFYTLHALSTLLFDKPAFLNVICLGHILDGEGQKMSKSKGNIVDPWQVFDEYGVDALRWFLFSASPPGNPRRFSTTLLSESLRQFILTLWNTYAFFVTYANLDNWQPKEAISVTAPIDQWALAQLNLLVSEVTTSMEAYDVTGAARAIESFVDELSNWYVRRNRRRFWKSETDIDKQAAYQTLYTCLVTLAKLIAPFAPFISEALYRNLVTQLDPTAPESVHLAKWPTMQDSLIDRQLVADTKVLIRVISLGRAARKRANLRVRQPLSELLVRVSTAVEVEGLRRFEADLKDELNLKAVSYLDASAEMVDYHCKPNLRSVGKKYGKLVPALNTTLRALSGEQARNIAKAVEARQSFALEVDGQTLELFPEDVLLESSSPTGYEVAENEGLLVALNTTLTPELRLEGLARDCVRIIQDARKNASLAISDRIKIYCGPGVQEVIATWGDYISTETLADTLEVSAIPAAAYLFELDLGDQIVPAGLLKQP